MSPPSWTSFPPSTPLGCYRVPLWVLSHTANFHCLFILCFSSSQVWMWELLYKESWVPKNWFGKDWRQEEKGMTENEMVGWHHWLDGHKFEQARSWWRKGRPGMLQSIGSQRDTTKWLNWTTTTFYTYVMYLGLESMFLCLYLVLPNSIIFFFIY